MFVESLLELLSSSSFIVKFAVIYWTACETGKLIVRMGLAFLWLVALYIRPENKERRGLTMTMKHALHINTFVVIFQIIYIFFSWITRAYIYILSCKTLLEKFMPSCSAVGTTITYDYYTHSFIIKTLNTHNESEWENWKSETKEKNGHICILLVQIT